MLSSTFWHVLAESILLVAFGQTIALCEAWMLCLKANLLRVKALLPIVNLLLAKALLQKAALLDWSAPGLRENGSFSHQELPRRPNNLAPDVEERLFERVDVNPGTSTRRVAMQEGLYPYHIQRVQGLSNTD